MINKKKLLGIFSFTPFVFGIIFLIVAIIWFPEGSENQASTASPIAYKILMISNIAGGLNAFVMVIIFFMHVSEDKTISRVWYFGLVFGNILAIPIFWYRFISSEGRDYGRPFERSGP